jgi:transposase
MFFDELSNGEWTLLAPIACDKPTPCVSRRGRPRAEPRVVANAILWILTTGEPWSRLPGQYPSIPTCRSRFEEWRSNGALGAMIQLLSHSGRTFAYIPELSSPVTRRAPERGTRRLSDDGLPSVQWNSADSWQALPTRISGSYSVDPFAQITRQLCSQILDAPMCIKSPTVEAADLPRQSVCHRESLWMGIPSNGIKATDRRGYVIYAAADPVANGLFRAWAEIVQDGRRIARSGLIGSRFSDLDAAQEYALDWARKWIDNESGTQPAAQTSLAAEITSPPTKHQVREPAMEETYVQTGQEQARSGRDDVRTWSSSGAHDDHAPGQAIHAGVR